MSTVQTTNIKHAASASNNITLDASGNVGVGTTPSTRLQVGSTSDTGTVRARVTVSGTGTPALSLVRSGLEEWMVQTASDGSLTSSSNGAERMRITAAGNVGIGTSAPQSALDVQSNTNYVARFTGSSNSYLGATIVNFNGGSAARSYLQFGNDASQFGAFITLNSSTNTTELGGANALGIYNGFGTPIAFATAGVERMRIDGSGNVGIGTASPGERLQVSGGNFGVLGATGSSFTGIVNQNNGASGSAYRGLFYDARNENGVAVANMLVDVNPDGSSAWAWSTTPAGSRASDRRVDRARITSTGDFQFNSGYGSVATAFGCRAWVNFNGTGTVAIRASGNVSSITDRGTGLYTVNFTTAMPDANYSQNVSSDFGASIDTAPTTSSCTVFTYATNSVALQDRNFICVSVFR